ACARRLLRWQRAQSKGGAATRLLRIPRRARPAARGGRSPCFRSRRKVQGLAFSLRADRALQRTLAPGPAHAAISLGRPTAAPASGERLISPLPKAPAPVGDDRASGVVAGRSGHASAGVCARSAMVESLQRSPIIGIAESGARPEQLIERHCAVNSISAGEAKHLL